METRLMGMPIHGVSFEQAIIRIFEGLAEGRGGRVLTPNVDVLRQYRGSAALRKPFDETELIVTDGVPLVWALRIQGTPVPQRITGTDMLIGVAAEAAARGCTVLLAGGRPGEAERAAQSLVTSNPGLVAKAHACYLEPTLAAKQLTALLIVISKAKPDIVFLGLPFIYQLSVMSSLRKSMPGTWFVGVGSSFEFLSGARRRAPDWLQRLGLEWAFRLTQQPGLWRRYLLQGLPFAAHLGLHVMAERVRRSQDSALKPELE